MKKSDYLGKIWRSFRHPRVAFFLLIGIAIIFLTFSTSNNALEIAISAMASVFIGIGVNNFSAMETHEKDEQRLRSKIGHLLKVMKISHSRISAIHREITAENIDYMKEELAELEQIIEVSTELMIDENRLN